MQEPDATTPPASTDTPVVPAALEPTTVPVKPVMVTAPHRSHTYEDDVAKAMNATDASVVQELLTTARERETVQEEFKKNAHQRKWYGLFSAIFIILALAGFGYGTYHYYKLTVPVKQRFSVGVFPSTAPIVVSETDVRKTITELSALSSLSEGKPMLVPFVTDGATLTPVNKDEFFSFLESSPSEPLLASIDIARLGIMNTGLQNTPFLIFSVVDPEVASKELLIAEPALLQLFYKALGIDIASHVSLAGKGFESTYLYNLPVRRLTVEDTETGETPTVLLYGYATNNIVVITTKPEVLKAVYDTIIRQR